MIGWINAALARASDTLAGVGAPRVEVIAERPALIVDVYWADLGPGPKWTALAAAPGYVGAVLKATEGNAYQHDEWFVRNWPRLRAAGGDRYGVDWFRGAYHYLRFGHTANVVESGRRQADYYLRTIERAGGWSHGDMVPVVDVELGREGGQNHRASAAQVVETAGSFVSRVKEITGREVMLYGRGAMRDLGITDQMGCRWLWNPSYTRAMPRKTIERVGWSLEDVALWQYTDGTVSKAITKGGVTLPRIVPGFGAVDCSVFLLGGSDGFRRRLVQTPAAR